MRNSAFLNSLCYSVHIALTCFSLTISLIKMLYWRCKSLNRSLNPSDLQYAIRRNFDGFGRFDDTLSCFYRKLDIQVSNIMLATFEISPLKYRNIDIG